MVPKKVASDFVGLGDIFQRESTLELQLTTENLWLPFLICDMFVQGLPKRKVLPERLTLMAYDSHIAGSSGVLVVQTSALLLF